ncbi:minor capsid protein [Clostridium sp. P21]|uniref:Minor capsid protein n=1 Tax=Clostridium muellerianum TaxID=2716538 RepID=A0A7Y0EJ15_9CLOT|nr:minor capsid protein [Clostridium muellerianum]NMM64391.1 minor capsid protein [Clostridium muellerianum]
MKIEDKNKDKKLHEKMIALFLFILKYTKQIDLLMGTFKENRELIKTKINQIYLTYPNDDKLQLTSSTVNKITTELQPLFKQVINNLTLQEDEALGSLLSKVYKETYYKTSYIIGATKLIKLTDEQVAKIIKEKIDRKNAYDRNKINKIKFINQLIKEIKYNLIKGVSLQKMFKVIDKNFNTGVFYSHRLVENQLVIDFTKAQLQAYVDGGIEEVWYSAILDNVTTDLCKNLNDNIYPIGQAPIPILNTHVNCRSMLIPIIEGHKANSLSWEMYQSNNNITI